jgi:actin-related protein 5
VEIKKKQRKDAGLEDEPEEEPSFPLLDHPDEELGEDGLKEKRRQRLMKAGYDARVKLREAKKAEMERVEEEKRQEVQFRLSDPTGWSAQLRTEQEVRRLYDEQCEDTDWQAIINRMEERKKRKAQLGDRKSVAAQARMKTIASLAADEGPSKKRKKAGESGQYT